MSQALIRFWEDQSGGTKADLAIAVGLVVVAAALWLAQIGGQGGVADGLVTLSWHLREFGQHFF